jgi:bifunctional non-homologous end joining protein LigD
VLRPLRFIPPAQPIERSRPPKGTAWLHEVKWDGYRCQLHRLGDRVVVYSRNGKEFTGRFSGVWGALGDLPAKSAIIDAEIVACRDDGAPDSALYTRATTGTIFSAPGASTLWGSMAPISPLCR